MTSFNEVYEAENYEPQIITRLDFSFLHICCFVYMANSNFFMMTCKKLRRT